MADIPPPRLRVSRSGFQDSQYNVPSEYLRESVQLQGTSAPFPDTESEDFSAWKQKAETDSDAGDSADAHRSGNTATPGPSRTTAASNNDATPIGGQAHVLRTLTQRLGSPSTTPPVPRVPPVRSVADSDLDPPTLKSVTGSLRGLFRRQSGSNEDLTTPRQNQNGSRIPVSGKRGDSKTSLESESDLHPTNGVLLSTTPSISQTTSFKRLKAFMKRADADEISTSGTSGNERGSNESLPPKPKFEDLNQSVVDFPAAGEGDSAEVRASLAGTPDSSPDRSARPRTTSAREALKRPMSWLRRDRPHSMIGDRSFASGVVETSTPIKTKAERQGELEKSWGRPSPSPRNSLSGDLFHSHPGSSSPPGPLPDERPPRAHTPIEQWEHDREMNWNSPRPKEIGPRPEDGGLSRSGSSLSGRSRSSSISSISSTGPHSGNNSRMRDRATPSPAPSPRPSTPSRVRAVSSTTPAEIMRERERGWNKPHSPVLPHARTTSMSGADGAARSARDSPPASLGRSNSLGNSSRAVKSPSDGLRTRGTLVYRPTTPTSTLIRRSSLIKAVEEETESDGHGAQSQSDMSMDESRPAPNGTFESSHTPPMSEQDEQLAEQPSEYTSFEQSQRDESRLLKATGNLSTTSQTLESTTPISTPSRPVEVEAIVSTTSPPEVSSPPQRSIAELGTPSKRRFYEDSQAFRSPQVNLPPLPPESSSEEEGESNISPNKSGFKGFVKSSTPFSSMKTPKPPGGWNTPGNDTVPPFDDREHPHPKGKAVAALNLKTDETDSDAQSTPLARPSELEEVKSPEIFVSAPETPARNPSEQTVTITEFKTPAPPGHWASSTREPKSILKSRGKVHFEPSPPAKSKSPDEVRQDSMNILASLAGMGSDDESAPSRARSRDDSMRKRPKINMVDSFGQDLQYAGDGTSLRRARIESVTSFTSEVPSVVSSHPGLAESSAVEMSVTTPRRRPKMRLVNSYGMEVHNAASELGVSKGVVDLNSPVVDTAPVEFDFDPVPLDAKSRISKVRRGLDKLLDSSTDGSDIIPAEVLHLNDSCDQSKVKRDQIRQRQAREAKISLRPIEVGSGSGVAGILQRAKYSAGTLLFAVLVVPLSLAALSFVFEAYVRYRTERTFLVTYHDPVYAGFYDSGDSRAPKVPHLLRFAMSLNPIPGVKTWFADYMYTAFGISAFYEPFHPIQIPS